MKNSFGCENCGFAQKEPETRLEIALTWLSRISSFLAIVTVAAAVGFLQGAQYVAEEATARFDCVAKP